MCHFYESYKKSKLVRICHIHDIVLVIKRIQYHCRVKLRYDAVVHVVISSCRCLVLVDIRSVIVIAQELNVNIYDALFLFAVQARCVFIRQIVFRYFCCWIALDSPHHQGFFRVISKFLQTNRTCSWYYLLFVVFSTDRMRVLLRLARILQEVLSRATLGGTAVFPVTTNQTISFPHIRFYLMTQIIIR